MSHNVCTRKACHGSGFTNRCFYCSCSPDPPQRAGDFQEEGCNASSALKLIFFSEDLGVGGMLLLCPCYQDRWIWDGAEGELLGREVIEG